MPSQRNQTVDCTCCTLNHMTGLCFFSPSTLAPKLGASQTRCLRPYGIRPFVRVAASHDLVQGSRLQVLGVGAVGCGASSVEESGGLAPSSTWAQTCRKPRIQTQLHHANMFVRDGVVVGSVCGVLECTGILGFFVIG